jgi:hypothetical protein
MSTRQTLTDLHEDCATAFRSDEVIDAARCRTRKRNLWRKARIKTVGMAFGGQPALQR